MESLSSFPRWKRALDLTCVLLTLPFWLFVMVFLTIWIKLVSRGPVLFKQVRVGLGEHPFLILKFRSMHQGVPTEVHENHVRDLIRSDRPLEKLDCSDQRVIPLGRFIRALGFDELPQLINVLRGEMSLVGPRPSTVQEFEVFGAMERRRVQVPPGLTGIWQVSGKNKLKFSEMIDLDLEYAKSMSLSGDVSIMFRTIPALLTQWREMKTKRRSARIQARAQAEKAELEMKASQEKEWVQESLHKSNCLSPLGSGIRKL